MPRRQEDPQVTDLSRYRRARELQRRQAARRAASRPEPLLGLRPRAGLILILVIVALAVALALPRLH